MYLRECYVLNTLCIATLCGTTFQEKFNYKCAHTQVKAKAQQEAVKIVLFFWDKITTRKKAGSLLLHKKRKEGNMKKNVFANISEVRKLINKCRSNKIPKFIHFEKLCHFPVNFFFLEKEC
jgi:hypothetical protein